MVVADAPVVLIAGAQEPLGRAVARAVLDVEGRVAVAVQRQWQVDLLREELGGDGVLVGLVAPRDAQAAAGFVTGARDALGRVTHFVGASFVLRERVPGREPAGDFEEMLDRNLHANATLIRAVLPSFRRTGGTLHLPALPSPAEDLSPTCRASLAALQVFGAALSDELAATDVRVAAFTPPGDVGAVVAVAQGLAAGFTASA